MTGIRALWPLVLFGAPLFLAAACDSPQPARSRAVLTLYTHADGKTKCVSISGDTLKADPGCCPDGFTLAGFASPAATAYHHPEEGVKKYQYRHVVCLEDLPPEPPKK